jgi:hypothetical protein
MVPWDEWGKEEGEGRDGYIGLGNFWGSLGMFHRTATPEPSEITASVSSEISEKVQRCHEA